MLASRVLVARLAWIVSFTLLVAACLPGLAQVFVSPQPGEVVEICSASGTVMLQVQAAGDERDSSPSGGVSSSMNCPCCALHHGAPALPPSDVLWTPPDALRFPTPSLFLQAPRPLFAWAPALARGPPLLSGL